jgi:hypothetical protein
VEIGEAGPLKSLERPYRKAKGKGKAREWESVHVEPEEGEMALLDKQWEVRQKLLADWILKKRMKIEVLFQEVATLEELMGQ